VAASEIEAAEAECTAAATGQLAAVVALEGSKTRGELRRMVAELKARCAELASRKRFLTHQVLSSSGAVGGGGAPSAAAGGAEGAAGAAGGSGAQRAGQGASAGSAGASTSVVDLTADEGVEGIEGEGEEEGEECPICRCAMQEDVIVLHCGHVFCDECASEHLSRRAECPMCRKPVKQSQVGCVDGGVCLD